MSLEEDIKQKNFKNEYQKLALNILYTSRQLYAANSALLKPYGITSEQYNILRILRGQHPSPATIALLIDRMLDKSSNASRIVERLRIKGLVSRNESKKDRRLVDVLITPKGLELLKELDEKEDDWLIDMEKLLTKEEAKSANEILDKIRYTK